MCNSQGPDRTHVIFAVRPSVRPSPDRELELYATQRGQFRPRVRVGVGSHLGFHSGRAPCNFITRINREQTLYNVRVDWCGIRRWFFFLRPLWMDDLLPWASPTSTRKMFFRTLIHRGGQGSKWAMGLLLYFVLESNAYVDTHMSTVLILPARKWLAPFAAV